MEGRSYRSPTWYMFLLLLIICLYDIFFTYLYGVPYELTSLLRPLVILIETILYYIIRNRINDQSLKWAWRHVICMMVALIALPVLRPFLMFFTLLYQAADPDLIYDAVGPWLFWSLIIVGHVYFIMVLAKSLSQQPKVGREDQNL